MKSSLWNTSSRFFCHLGSLSFSAYFMPSSLSVHHPFQLISDCHKVIQFPMDINLRQLIKSFIFFLPDLPNDPLPKFLIVNVRPVFVVCKT
jgi:hypothetical protein